MSSKNTLGILFHTRNEKKNKQGQVPIYVRITVNGKRSAVSIKRYTSETSWDPKAGRVKGTNEEAKKINRHIDQWKSRIYEAQEQLIKEDELVTAKAIKTILDGNYKKQYTLLEAFDKHYSHISKLKGLEYAPATLTRYETTKRHIENFLADQYHIDDIRLNKLSYQFVTDFEEYLRTERKCNHNTTAKYIKNLKKIINYALDREWLVSDPFKQYKIKIKEVKRDYLSEKELNTLISKDIKIERLDLVRDLFVFSCYTGLAYVDITKLTNDNLRKGIDDEIWIFAERTKTKNASNIPLLQPAADVINKYSYLPDSVKKGKLLPFLSNQKTNAYLKEIADSCGITKNLTFHLARHTFATTVTLAKDVPIESVSYMLGHKSIRTTQIYAKVTEQKVSRDMAILSNKISQQENQEENESKAN